MSIKIQNSGWATGRGVYVPNSRQLSTTTPLSGGDNLGQDLTISIGGLSSQGLSNQIPGVSGDASGWEYKTLIAGSGVSITHAAGSITIDAGVSVGGWTAAGGAVVLTTITDQVGIGTASPNAFAALDITSTTRGFLPPRMTQTQRDVITATAGLVVYNTTSASLNLYNGSAWTNLVSGGGGAPDNATYVVISLDGTLTSERVLAGTANQIVITDGGAGGNVTLSTPQSIHTAATPTFGGALFNGTVELYNSTTAQTFRVYNTRTDASNYERGFLRYSSNILQVGHEALGTGSGDRSVQLRSGDANILIFTNGSNRWQFGTSADTYAFAPNTDNAYDIGTTALRLRSLYAATSIGVGGTTIDASAALQLNSTAKGFLPPRMTATQRDAITSPATGLVVYSTTSNELFVYNGAWTALAGGGGGVTGASYLVLGLDAGLSAERVLVGTANQVILSDGGANGNLTLSLPQSIHTGAAPTFAGFTNLTGDITLHGETGSNKNIIVGARTSAAGGLYLNIQGGGVLAGSTNQTGGTVFVTGGNATGNGGSEVEFWTVRDSQGSGTTARTATLAGKFDLKGRFLTQQAIVPKVSTLTPGTTVNTDAAAGNLFRLTAAQNFTLAAPTNATDGQVIRYHFIQDGTGSRVLTLSTSAGGFAGGSDITIASVVLSTAAGTLDVMSCEYRSSVNRWIVIGFARGY